MNSSTSTKETHLSSQDVQRKGKTCTAATTYANFNANHDSLPCRKCLSTRSIAGKISISTAKRAQDATGKHGSLRLLLKTRGKNQRLPVNVVRDLGMFDVSSFACSDVRTLLCSVSSCPSSLMQVLQGFCCLEDVLQELLLQHRGRTIADQLNVRIPGTIHHKTAKCDERPLTHLAACRKRQRQSFRASVWAPW